MNTLKYKGYIGTVDYSEEDKCLFGKIAGMPKSSITYEGTSVDELEEDFHNAVDDYLAECKERGLEPVKPFSGSLNIRIPSDIHGKIAILSKSEGISINAFIKHALEKQLELAH